MKRLATLIVPLLLAGHAAFAQPEQAGSEPERPTNNPATREASGSHGAIVVNQRAGTLLGRDIVGARVMSGPGKDAVVVGLVQDVLVSSEGRIVGGLVGVGGFLGIGEKTVAVSWDALRRIDGFGDAATFTTSMTRAQLEAAPAFISLAERKAAEQKREVLENARQQRPAPDALRSGRP